MCKIIDDWTYHDLMGNTTTDADGRFYVEGSQDDDPGSQIEPYLRFNINGYCCSKVFFFLPLDGVFFQIFHYYPF